MLSHWWCFWSPTSFRTQKGMGSHKQHYHQQPKTGLALESDILGWKWMDLIFQPFLCLQKAWLRSVSFHLRVPFRRFCYLGMGLVLDCLSLNQPTGSTDKTDGWLQPPWNCRHLLISCLSEAGGALTGIGVRSEVRHFQTGRTWLRPTKATPVACDF